MKLSKIFILCLSAVLLFVAQQSSAQTDPFGRGFRMPLAVGDTAVNTTAVSKIFTATGGYGVVSVQPVSTRLTGSGTMTITWAGSIDGTNYTTIGTIVTGTTTTTTAVASQATNPYVYYKVTATPAGTQTAQIRIWYVLRKYLTQ